MIITQARSALAAVLLTLATTVAATCHEDNAKQIWTELLSKCAYGDQLDNVMFFSMSNNIGPGSIWRQTEDNGYIAVRPAPEGISSVISEGTANDCKGQSARIANLSSDVAMAQLAGLTSASIALALQDAESVTISTPAWQWDQVYTGQLQDLISSLDESSGYLRDLSQYRLIIGRALRINGYSARAEFSNAKAAELRANNPLTASGGVTARWASDRVLEFSGSQPAYIAVQMYRWGEDDGFAALELRPIPVTPASRIISAEPENGGQQ